MSNLKKVIRVGISDLNIATSPSTIRTSGLGSCVGAVIYDLQKKVGGLAHIMLPDSNLTKQGNVNEYKFADTAIPILIERLCENGARKHALKAKMAGGAQMFQFSSSTNVMRIGERNIAAVEEQLQSRRIPIVASDVGGKWGRTIEFDPGTGELNIRAVNKAEKII